MRTHWILVISLLSLTLGSCGGSVEAVGQSPELIPQEISTEEPSFTPPENPLQLNTPETIDMPSNPPPVEKFVSLSKKDLASLLQVEADKISLVKTEETIWPDAALGCPSPGKVYAQGKVPGYRIRLEAGGKEYDYHTDFTGLFVLCPETASRNSDSPPSITSSPTPHIGVPID